MGDMLASMFNIIGFSWDSCPAATEMEIVVLGERFYQNVARKLKLILEELSRNALASSSLPTLLIFALANALRGNQTWLNLRFWPLNYLHKLPSHASCVVHSIVMFVFSGHFCLSAPQISSAEPWAYLRSSCRTGKEEESCKGRHARLRL